MDQTLYHDGVVVDQDDLNRTESTKRFHIINRHLNMSTPGVLTGIVTLNPGDATLLNISAFTGFVPNGEYIESLTNQVGMSLADYTNGVVNYVIALYSEINSVLKPHETNGYSYPTKASRNCRIKIITSAEYDAMADSDDNLNNDARDRTLILAKVTANGVGVALTASSIINPIEFGSAASAINQTATITGVSIIGIDKNTSVGDGILQLTVVGVTKTITWMAPGETTPGVSVDISATGTYYVYSSATPTGRYLKLSVIGGSLPTIPATYTDTILISNIYAQIVPRFTGEDLQHRSMLGTGTPTTTNPHGLTATDLGVTAELEEHQKLFHNKGILFGSTDSFLKGTINRTGADTLSIGSGSAGDAFYINGIKHTNVDPSIVSFPSNLAQILYDIFVQEGTEGVGVPTYRERAKYTTSPPPSIASKVQLRDVSLSTTSGTGQIAFNTTTDVLSYKAPGDAFGEQVAIPTSSPQILRLYSNNRTDYIDVYVNNTMAGDPDNTGENIAITQSFTGTDLASKIRIITIMCQNDELGNGFPISGGTPGLKDQRQYGTLCLENVRDDLAMLESGVSTASATLSRHNWISELDTPALRPSRPLVTMRSVGIGLRNPSSRAKFHVMSSSSINDAIIGDASLNSVGVGVTGYGSPGVLGSGKTGQIGTQGVSDSNAGVWGTSYSYHGVHGESTSSYGVYGESDTSYGVRGESSSFVGMRGIGAGIYEGVRGDGGVTDGTGVTGYGGGTSGYGVFGLGGTNGPGVVGTGQGGGSGVIGSGGTSGVGVWGRGFGSAAGVHGVSFDSGNGVEGYSYGGGSGVYGYHNVAGEKAVYGYAPGGGYGVVAEGKLDPSSTGGRAAFRIVPQTDIPNVQENGAIWIVGGVIYVRVSTGTFTLDKTAVP